MFFSFFKLYKWYQIAQRTTNDSTYYMICNLKSSNETAMMVEVFEDLGTIYFVANP